MKALYALIAASICCAVPLPVYAAATTCANAAEGPSTLGGGRSISRNYDVKAGDLIRITTSRNITTQIKDGGRLLFSNTAMSSTYTVPSDNINLQVLLIDPLIAAASTYSIACTPAAAVVTPPTNVTAAGSADADQTAATQINTQRQQLTRTAAQATGQSQGLSVGAGIRNAIAGTAGSNKQPIMPFGNGGLYFTAPISDPDGVSGLEGWAAFSASSYDGTTDGSGYDLTFGVQRDFTDLLTAGIVGNFGTLDLTSGTTSVEARAFVAGPYFAYEHENLTFNGYVVYGRPEYDFGGGVSADAERLAYSLGVSGRFPQSRYIVSPFLNLSGFQEDIDAVGTLAAQDISQYALGFGSRVDFVTRGALNPYVAIGFDAWEFDNGANRSDGVSPRLEAGLSMIRGSGTFNVDLSASEISNDMRRYGVSLRYDLRF